MSNLRLATSALFAFALTAPAPLPAQEVDAEADVAFALDQLEERCGHFFEQKQIDWNKVRKQFTRDAKQVRDAQGEFELLVRLLARLRDGHAEVRPSDRAGAVQWPGGTERGGYGMFWCRVGKKTFVKNAWGPARELGLTPGMEVSKVDGQPIGRWLDARVATIAELTSFSTDHQAMFFALHWGLSDVPGTRLKLELNDGRKKVTRTLTADAKVRQVPDGPAFYPGEVQTAGDLRYSTTTQGYGYVHVRRCKGDLPARMDEALAALADPPGLILDFRGNSGGGFDHEALFGRFVPTGETLAFGKSYASAGANPYIGPVVVIVDATARSAGETGSGMFREDGRAYMIGESPTAGMSAVKETIELPSGMFSLYVAVHSNMARFNDGRGLEGVGAVPHELVEFDREDLEGEIDTLIRVAEERLSKFPQEQVRYDPADFGWKR